MKRFFYLPVVALLTMVILASCTKRDHYDNNNYNETGQVDYVPDYYSPYFIVYLPSDGSFAIVQSLDGPKFWPIIDEKVYGNFNNTGRTTLNNRTGGFDMYVDIVAFRNNRNTAIYDLEGFEDEDGYGPSAINKNNQLSIGKDRIRIK